MDKKVIRTKRKTISVTVKGGQVIVSAPKSTKDDAIEDFLRRHRRWIGNRLSEQPASLPSLADGSTLLLFGEPYTVKTGRARIGAGEICLPAEGRKEALVGILKRLALGYMEEKTRRIAFLCGFTFGKVRVGSARTRWGSCKSDGTITYSFRACLLPPEEAEYLAVHELCHTKFMDHSYGFWGEVEKILPDYRSRRKRLKSYLWAMQWL